MEEVQKVSDSKCDISYMEPEELGYYVPFDALFPATLDLSNYTLSSKLEKHWH